MRSGKESNFSIWDQVKHTNPKYTKPFSKFGGKTLTTIDPMYQIQVMTGIFGPVGKGWTYNVNYTYTCLLYTSPSPRDLVISRMPSSA